MSPTAPTRSFASALAARGAKLSLAGCAVWLAPLLTVAVTLLQLWLAGERHTITVATNLETPRLSSGRRVVDLVTAAEQRARIFEATLSGGAERAAPGPRVRVQLASGDQTRILLVRDAVPDGSRAGALRDWLAGRARLAVVADRGWLDLGPVPPPGDTRRVQVVGLLPGAFSFFRVVQPPATRSAPAPTVDVTLAGWSDGRPLPAVDDVRFVLVAPDPLPLSEVLARVLAFVGQSGVLVVALALATLAVVVGWARLDRPRHAVAAFLLLAGSVTVHAVLLPPLQGADETSHVATIEGLIAKGVKYRSWWYPESIAMVATALDQDRVQHQPSEPLPVRGATERVALDAVMTSPLEQEFQRPGEPPAGAFGQVAESRAPAFYHVFRVLDALAPRLSVADRLALYRLASVASGLALLGAGLALLVASGLGRKLAAPYCALFTFPYALIVLASCSNYAPAIGCGGIAGAAAVAAILAPGRRARRVSRAVLIASLWLGVGLWRDFVLAALVLTVPAALALPPFTDPADGTTRPWRRTLAILAAIALVGGVALWESPGALGPELVARATTTLGQQNVWLYLLAVSPLAAAVLLVALDRRHRGRPIGRRRRDARMLSIGLAVAVVVLGLVTPATRLDYQKSFLVGWDFVSAATATVLSTNLSWDQDRLTWIFVLGAGGWHDVFFPDAVYALARWLAVAVAVALPLLSLRCRVHRPRVAAALLVLAGIGLTLMAASLAVRHSAFVHPHGRFVLPWLGLALLPVIARVCAGRDDVARLVLRLAVLFHLWASFVVVGLRYAVGS